jgi:hypothetical protein
MTIFDAVEKLGLQKALSDWTCQLELEQANDTLVRHQVTDNILH